VKNAMCYCGKAEEFEQCCKPIIDGTENAKNAEILMRSRYSAYCIKNIDYIYQTYAPSERLNNSKPDIALFADQAVFCNLNVCTYQHNKKMDKATVHFKADYFVDALFCQLEEVSNFVKDNGKWFYIDGEITAHPDYKVARNEKCPCGSNKKFKHCHAR
jgi:SEC-C motif-containing protein